MRDPNEYDVVVVGGGPAGLSAALVLGRFLRRTLVLDTGEPRNAPSSGVHYFLTRDGTPPGEMLNIGREQLEPYDGVEVRQAKATGADGSDGGFEVVLEGGNAVGARKILLATGVHDELPERPGFRELWGRGVYHCPYCHGWEVRGRPLAILNRTEQAAEYAAFIRNWSRDLVLLSDGPSGLDAARRGWVAALNVPLREEKILHLQGGDGSLRRIVFEDGSSLEREGIFYGPQQHQRSPLAESLGCEIEAIGSLPFVVVKSDPTTRETTVPGVYVAGDAGNAMQSAIMAAASGASAGAMLNHALVAENAEAEVASASNDSDSAAVEDAP